MTTDSNQEFLLDAPEDIYGALRKIVLMSTPVKVRVDGSDEEYTSALTSTDLKSRSFFLDKVIPQQGNDLIRSGKRFNVECDSQGVRIEFRMSGRLKYQPQNEQYRAEFPEKVLYLQRRTAYRVMVPPAHQILLKIKMNDGEGDLAGQLKDLSSNGFKAAFSGNVKKRLEEQRTFDVARIRFNRENTLDLSLEAHHIFIDDNGHTVCGFSISMISPMGQRYIDKLITEFQWEERQNREQQEESLGDA
ncbi:flagellar brake protein [Thalassolituus marinus]|uniref:Flagellar brake protein n=1 Tax=Thalassolituus marinus TaxID=671053 RepID=A0ABS7ZN87_9GAMM|nr:flagellar brake protein [Thalassolituus marinus]MCA6062522.1 flagellar brake protein [Thalassolituus marinus]